ncbi:unnamed protein product [Cylicocyclus nassatus]|uniref:Methyltransferase domain-containing protein n=1 Tax=Cylicocyclus nassatus TaxID=53992 RepID=A0AA36H730_CYLNA|nr:unnamed protein product [Cylicocyclus nassatus]
MRQSVAAVVVSLAIISAVMVYQHRIYLDMLRSMYSSLSTHAQNESSKEGTDSWVRDYYSKQAADRIRALDAISNESANFAVLYNVLVPEVFCRDLVRVGNVVDGGKFVCNPKAMPKGNCSVYSLGLREDISFDRDIQEFNNSTCRIYGYDMTSQSKAVIDEYHAINGKIRTLVIGSSTNASENVYFLGDLLLNNGDTYAEFLKMDIEGAEHYTLIPFLKLYSVCQLFLEVHHYKPINHVKLLQQIARLDYALFFYEVNGDSLQACEYSFIHLTCMKRYGVSMLKLYLKFIKLP